MLVNLSPRNDFRTQREKQRTHFVRWFGKEGKYPKSSWVNFESLFRPTEYTGIYNSDFDGEMINTWCKQMAYYSSRHHRKHRGEGYNQNYWYYGVADNIEQVIEFYNDNQDTIFFGNHVISCFEVKKSSDCGWRWHKWGPYIGIERPQCEYLADEPVIEKVVCFSIYKVR